MLCRYKKKNITETPFLDDCRRVRHLVDKRSLHFGNKTVCCFQKKKEKKEDIRSFIVTLIRKIKAKGNDVLS